jgi:CheY-like chemotaxis protein
MHGREILDLLKANDRFKSIPVVILTTSSSKDDREYSLGKGAAEYITKPCTVEGFNDMVNLITSVATKALNRV